MIWYFLLALLFLTPLGWAILFALYRLLVELVAIAVALTIPLTLVALVYYFFY